MALHHANPGDAIDVRPLGDKLRDARTVALFKARDLEVMRAVLLAGRSLPPHRVAGAITIQCVEGTIDVTAGGASHLLAAGQLLFLDGDMEHGVTAIEDASFLVTIALRN